MILGITGLPGSGKSEVAALFAENGWRLIDADLLGHEVVENDETILMKLREAFGDDIIRSDGGLDRRKLARRAFESRESTERLNSIVHARLIEELNGLIEEKRGENIDTVVDSALIHEWNIGSYFDTVICVTADKEIRIQRILERDRRTRSEIEALFASQLPEQVKAARCDLVVTNNASSADLISKVKSLPLWRHGNAR